MFAAFTSHNATSDAPRGGGNTRKVISRFELGSADFRREYDVRAGKAIYSEPRNFNVIHAGLREKRELLEAKR